jgi:hypothetical protein
MDQYDLAIFNMADVDPTQRDNINLTVQNMYNRGDLDLNAPLGSYIVLRVLNTKMNQVISEMSQYRFRNVPKGSQQYNFIASQQPPVGAIISQYGQVPQVMQMMQPGTAPVTAQTQPPSTAQVSEPSVSPLMPKPVAVDSQEIKDAILAILKTRDNRLASIIDDFEVVEPLVFSRTFMSGAVNVKGNPVDTIKETLRAETKTRDAYEKKYTKDDRMSQLKKELKKAGVPGFLKKVGNIFRKEKSITTGKISDFQSVMTGIQEAVDEDVTEGRVLYKKYLLLLLIVHYDKLPEGVIKNKVTPYYTALYSDNKDLKQTNIDNIFTVIKEQFKILQTHLTELHTIMTQYSTKIEREETALSSSKGGARPRRSQRAHRSQLRRRLKKVE